MILTRFDKKIWKEKKNWKFHIFRYICVARVTFCHNSVK